MKIKTGKKRWLVLVTALALVLAFGAQSALAAVGTFDISVYHGINGRSLGLSKDLPVIAEVYKDGALLAEIPLSFKDRIATELPAGEYTIMVRSVELGAYIPSMTVGPVDIPAGVDVSLHAKLSADKTPILKVKVR